MSRPSGRSGFMELPLQKRCAKLPLGRLRASAEGLALGICLAQSCKNVCDALSGPAVPERDGALAARPSCDLDLRDRLWVVAEQHVRARTQRDRPLRVAPEREAG